MLDVDLKFHRNLSFHEASKILGTSNIRLLEMLRENKILFKENNRNLPIDRYIKNGWFEVYFSEVNNSDFSGCVPIVRITKKGFFEIKKIAIENSQYLKILNNLTFKEVVRKKISDSLNDLGLKKFDNDDWIFKNSVNHICNKTGNTSIFIVHDENIRYLVVFNRDKKKIIND